MFQKSSKILPRKFPIPKFRPKIQVAFSIQYCTYCQERATGTQPIGREELHRMQCRMLNSEDTVKLLHFYLSKNLPKKNQSLGKSPRNTLKQLPKNLQICIQNLLKRFQKSFPKKTPPRSQK